MRRLVLLCATVLLALPAAAHAAAPPPQQRIAVLLSDHTVYASPGRTAKRITTLAEIRPLTGARTAVPIVAEQTRRGEGTWLRVRLPGRPNGRTGWVSAQGIDARTTPWHVVVELRKRRVLTYENGRRVRTDSVIIGARSTPTPQGRYFVEEIVPMGDDEPGAPWALATSARSNALQRYEGGVGQIALHGTGNLTGTLGTPGSHGCVRLTPPAITWLATHLEPGVPITITAA
jgi:lipoprotein-anchoring transpeptidase ErfK/SrfK